MRHESSVCLYTLHAAFNHILREKTTRHIWHEPVFPFEYTYFSRSYKHAAIYTNTIGIPGIFSNLKGVFSSAFENSFFFCKYISSQKYSLIHFEYLYVHITQ